MFDQKERDERITGGKKESLEIRFRGSQNRAKPTQIHQLVELS
jgi:hypothetical protein